jgi:hypothetical protein
MGLTRRSIALSLFVACLSACAPPQQGGNPPGAAASSSPSQPSSNPLAAAFRQQLGGERIIWGYYDSPSLNGTKSRIYCEIDAKTGEKFAGAFEGEVGKYANGKYGIKRGQASFLDCTKLDAQGKLIVTGYPSTEKAIDRLKLRDILPQYDEDGSIKNQYPHVAITVLKSPIDWQQNLGAMRPYALGCWTLSLTVWDTVSKSRKIAPFQYCLPQDGSDEVAFNEGAKWPERAKIDIPNLTGIRRTDGPMPPATPIPNDRQTADLAAKRGANYWSTIVSGRIVYQTSTTMMFETIRHQLGARYNGEESHDLRVWITKIDD